MSLEDLKAKRDEINRQIASHKNRETLAAKARASKAYVKIVCGNCKGDGNEYDHRSPAILGACCSCNGRGYLWARRWEGKRGHDMDWNGKEGEYPKEKK